MVLLDKLSRRIVAPISKQFEDYELTDFFYGKRIVLIGPSSKYSLDLLSNVRMADIVVFLNMGYRTSLFKSISFMSSCTVLFHCLHPSESVGGGKINTIQLRRLGIASIMFGHYGDYYSSLLSGFHQINYGLLRLHRVNSNVYSIVRSYCPGFIPTTGFAAIACILHSNCSRLYVTGLNFYRQPYINNYRPFINSNLSATVEIIQNAGLHNPDLEFLSVRRMQEKLPLVCDETLQEIIDSPYEQIFYKKN